MIPLRDKNPTRTIPFVNYGIIALNVLVFLVELSVGKQIGGFIFQFGVVPARLVEAVQTVQLNPAAFYSLFSSMFLHGGWMHLVGNMLFLHVFGDNVEDRFGHTRYFFFYGISGLGAALTQVFFNPLSQIPMVGASGAIAGVLGAYMFLYPRARVITLIPIFFFFQIVELPAYFFLGFWFLLQFLSGMMALGIGADAGGVAWWAHIGGFACGALLLPFLRKHRST
jgi:membrane associated rhomboid family serine protease